MAGKYLAFFFFSCRRLCVYCYFSTQTLWSLGDTGKRKGECNLSDFLNSKTQMPVLPHKNFTLATVGKLSGIRLKGIHGVGSLP